MDQEPRRRAKNLRPAWPQDKELIWIENAARRLRDGYNYFGRYPEKILAFLDKHVK